jgi:type II secretory pathway component PulC
MMVWLRKWTWQDGGSAVLELVLTALLGIGLAYWTWVALSPRAVAVSTLQNQQDEERVAAAVNKRNLFGAVQEGKAVAVVDASSSSPIKLLGVVASGVSGAGRAIFVLESGRPKTVEAGWQVEPGFVLKEVYPDYVIVARNGALERIKLNRRAAPKS